MEETTIDLKTHRSPSSGSDFQSVIDDQSSSSCSLSEVPRIGSIPAPITSSPSLSTASNKLTSHRIPVNSTNRHQNHSVPTAQVLKLTDHPRRKGFGILESLDSLVGLPFKSFSSRLYGKQIRLPRCRLKTFLLSGLGLSTLVILLTMSSENGTISKESMQLAKRVSRKQNVSRLLGHIGNSQFNNRDKRLEKYPTANEELPEHESLLRKNPAGSAHSDQPGYLKKENRRFSGQSAGFENSGRPKILCWLMTDPKLLEKTAPARDTWMSRCDVMLFMSSVKDDSFPTIGLEGIHPGRDNIAAKSKASWNYIYKHHLNDADFFLKADPDSYIMIDNLRQYLTHCNTSEPNIYGHALWYPNPGIWQTCYVAGQAVVLTRESLRRLVEVAFVKYPDCFHAYGQAEDLKTSLCLGLVGARVMDTRDNFGRETFLPPLCPSLSMAESKMKQVSGTWYKSYRPFGYCLEGSDCYSDKPVAFHCVYPDSMFLLNYLEVLINAEQRARDDHIVTSGEQNNFKQSTSAEGIKTHNLSFRNVALCENGDPV